jgi:DNA-binding PadR family transcriptional regulator
MLRRKDWEKIRQSFNKKLVRCFLDEIILAHFNDCAFSGYDVMAFLQLELGVHISAATVYGSLYSMERKGLLVGHSTSRKRVYEVTERGNLTLHVVASKEDIDRFRKQLLKRSKPIITQELTG